jgi:GNAT superfamily N-acetyltransferase
MLEAKPSRERSPGDGAPVTVRPLQPDDWPAITRLFGPNGACGGCWCMWWRVPRGGKLWEEAKGRKNRDAFRRLVQSGAVHGILAFSGDEPVGWCCFGPRRTFPRVDTVRALKRDCPDGTWSIVCFYVPARWRWRGVASALLEAATERALALGATEVEGYPVVPKKLSEQVPYAFAWTGVAALFQAAGYRQLSRPKSYRTIYLKK